MRTALNMCIINVDFVHIIADMAGSQSEIMHRIGISWNSWIKIVGGLPIRLTVGERLRDRVLRELHALDAGAKTTHSTSHPCVDWLDLESNFLRPVTLHEREGDHIKRLRSLTRARAIATRNHHVSITQSRASWSGEMGA